MYVYVVREYMWEGKIWGQSLYIWFQIFSGKRFDLATCSVQKQLSRSSQMAPRLAMCEIVWQMKAWSSWLERSTLNINSTNHQSAINKKQAVWCQLWMHCTGSTPLLLIQNINIHFHDIFLLLIFGSYLMAPAGSKSSSILQSTRGWADGWKNHHWLVWTPGEKSPPSTVIFKQIKGIWHPKISGKGAKKSPPKIPRNRGG